MSIINWDLCILKNVPDDRLLEEIIRRRNAEPDAKPEHWCHDCKYFESWDTKQRAIHMPDSYNPCTKGHAMQFIVPQDMGDEYGFYRRVCGDREVAEYFREEQLVTRKKLNALRRGTFKLLEIV